MFRNASNDVAGSVYRALGCGDRPKDTTYRRLLSCPTLAELDATFGNQSERNYRLLLPDNHPEAALPAPVPGDAFETVGTSESNCSASSTSCFEFHDDLWRRVSTTL